MKFLKKTAIFLLCFSAVCTSGCGNAAQSADIDRSILPESVQSLSFDEHMTISIGYWNIENMTKATEPDELTQYIEKLFNITIQPMSVTWTNYKERYQILAATGSLPDVFVNLTLSSTDCNDSAGYTDMIQNQSIRALPSDLSNYPLIQQLMDSVTYLKYSDDNFYCIPRISFNDSILQATDAAMIVRKDWMENLGITTPQSYEEFASMVTAFAKNDPDGNGTDDTIGYNVSTLSALGKWVILGIEPDCNIFTWVEENGRYVPSWTTKGFEKVVKEYQALYQSGGLDPDFYIKTPSSVLEDFASGRLGALEHKSSPSALMELKTLWDSLNEKPFEECVDILPIYPADDGIRYSNSSNAFWSESFISSSVDDAKLERILALFEFLLSDEGMQLCHYGFENIDYSVDDNQEYTCLLDTGKQSLTEALTEKYPSVVLFSNIASWGGSWADFEDNTLNRLRYGTECIQLSRKAVLWEQENTTQLNRPYDFLNFPKESTDLFSTSQAFDQFVKCIIGSNDALTEWRQVLQDMNASGLQDYINRQNELFQNHYN